MVVVLVAVLIVCCVNCRRCVVFSVEEGYFVEVPSCRGSSQWIIGHVDNSSGLGEKDNNTEEVEREGEEVLSVACSKG